MPMNWASVSSIWPSRSARKGSEFSTAHATRYDTTRVNMNAYIPLSVHWNVLRQEPRKAQSWMKLSRLRVADAAGRFVFAV